MNRIYSIIKMFDKRGCRNATKMCYMLACRVRKLANDIVEHLVVYLDVTTDVYSFSYIFYYICDLFYQFLSRFFFACLLHTYILYIINTLQIFTV